MLTETQNSAFDKYSFPEGTRTLNLRIVCPMLLFRSKSPGIQKPDILSELYIYFLRTIY